VRLEVNAGLRHFEGATRTGKSPIAPGCILRKRAQREAMITHTSTNMTRRSALKTIGAGLALAGLGGIKNASGAVPGQPVGGAGNLGWELPKLPYAYDALEPAIDAKTMEIHHTKHHQAYITNATNALKGHGELMAKGPVGLLQNVSAVPESVRVAVRNNVGGHVNHAFFWPLLAPRQGGAAPAGKLTDAIAKDFGSMEEFKTKFAAAAASRFGSGWAWLVVKDGRLAVTSTPNQDSPIMEGQQPVIGLDVWEHAYYLKYQNRRADYVKAFWDILNWRQAEENFRAAS
jgi:superoxide dismutase, Fe-Mn family